MQKMAIAATLAWLTLVGLLGAAEQPTWLGMELHLDGALPREADQQPKRLSIYLQPEGQAFTKEFATWSAEIGPWNRPQDKSQWYSRVDGYGLITSQERRNESLTIVCETRQPADPYVPDSAGKGQYTIVLDMSKPALTGTFSGTFKGQAVAGSVDVQRNSHNWIRPVPNLAPFTAGEHPRLLFRKQDLPALRERAQTEQGQAILKRLRLLLGGATGPEHFNSRSHAGNDGMRQLPLGTTFTLWHAAGFGFLYQLSGDASYAEKARSCVELARSGKRDRDSRYAYHKAGGRLRNGPSIAAIALAYDLCYEAWDADYRQALAKELAQKLWGYSTDAQLESGMHLSGTDLLFTPGRGQLMPHSNHYGAWIGGGGMATLAILNDPGVDPVMAHRANMIFQRRAMRCFEVGFGPTAYFFEGHHGGRLSTNSAFTAYLQSLRVALGRDAVSVHPAGRWLTAKWLYEIVRDGEGAGKLLAPQRGIYASHHFDRGGSLSKSGDFSQGFGIAPKELKPALRWFQEQVCDPGAKDWDAVLYPHMAIAAFVNWPRQAAVNPAVNLPRYLHDVPSAYLALRSGWSEQGRDVVITLSPMGGAKIQGQGLNTRFGINVPAQTPLTQLTKDAVTIAKPQHLFAVLWDLGPPVMLLEVKPRPGIVSRKDTQDKPGPGKPPPFLKAATKKVQNEVTDNIKDGVRTVVITLEDRRCRLIGPASDRWPEWSINDKEIVVGSYKIAGFDVKHLPPP